MNVRITLIASLALIFASGLSACFQGSVSNSTTPDNPVNLSNSKTPDNPKNVGNSNIPNNAENVSKPIKPEATKPNYLITPNSVGDIRIGTTIADARKVFKDAKFDRYNYGEEGIVIEVTLGKKDLMTLTTDQKDDGQSREGRLPIDEAAKIDSILISDSRYKTADGIHPGITIDYVEKKFGKIKEIVFYGLDASEHVTFASTPKGYSFTVGAKAGSDDEARAGIYDGDAVTTTKYSKDAVVSTIKISKIEKPDPKK